MKCRRCPALEAEIDKWKIASGLEKDGDPEKVTPRYMERYWSVIAGKVDRLEKENSRLRSENDLSALEINKLRNDNGNLKKDLEAIEKVCRGRLS